MNILKIAHKEWLQNIRNVPVMLIMTVLPLLIIMLIALALNSVFDGDAFTMSNLTIDYHVVGEKTNFSEGVEFMLSEFVTPSTQFKEVTDLDLSILNLKDGDLSSVIVINENNQTIKLYKNSLFNKHASIVENFLKNYTVKYNITTEVISLKGSLKPSLFQTTIRTLNKNEFPSAMDYYGVALTMMFTFYGIILPFTNTIKEKKTGTMDRILASSLSNIDLLVGKILGNILVNGIQLTIVVLSIVFIYNVNLGDHEVLAVMLMMTLVVFVVAFGVGLGFLLKSEEIGNAFIHTSIVAFAFFGGGYMPLFGMGLIGDIGQFFSPLWWSINGMMSMIYEDKLELLFKAMAINLIVSLVFVLFTSLIINKRGGKYA